MGARFNQLSVDLSQLLNDEVSGAGVDGKEFTAAQRTLIVNRAEAKFIQSAIEKMPNAELMINLKELVRSFSTDAPGSPPFASPTDSAKVVICYTGVSYFIYVKPSEWDAVRLQYNKEETATIYGGETVYRWTEMPEADGVMKVHVIPSFVGLVTMRYIKNHVDLTPASGDDLLVPARYDYDLLKLAYEFAELLLQKA